MDSRNHYQGSSGELLEATPELVSAFKRCQPARLFVPPVIDEAVLGAARRRLEKRAPARFRVFRSWKFWPAFATACLLLAALGYFVAKHALLPFGESSFAREDVNHDRHVDILDAFQLARQSHSGTASDRRLDLNGDGVVDGRDAEVVAAQAVKLQKGG